MTTEDARERSREANRRYRESHPERSREKTRRYRAANLEKARAATRQSVARWREAHPDSVAEQRQKHISKLKAAVLDHYGHACACCGAMERLTVDHVHGDGDVHRAEVGGGWAIYRWLVNNDFPEGFQILCRPCNASKKRAMHCRLDHNDDVAKRAGVHPKTVQRARTSLVKTAPHGSDPED
jgi:hypothetical protein